MDKKTIKQVAWVADEFVKGRIKGVILVFHGLGGGVKQVPTTEELAWAQKGGLVVYPYYGPWSWMNREARAFVDELVDSIYREYKLKDSAPLVSTGGSMGGLSALLYTRYARRPIAACLANCPVCDLKYHSTERPDLPKTIDCAFRGYTESREELFREHSPVCQVDHMPNIPYLILHGMKDKDVSKQHHSDKLVPLMRRRHLKVEYLQVKVMEHCGPMPPEVWMKQMKFVSGFLK